ncbi:MAG: UbiA prenyltransferase family protein [Actinomycetota bacterium]
MMWAIRLLVMMIRPPVALVLLLFAAIGLAVAGEGDGLHPLLTTVLLIVGGWFIHGTALNDVADEAIDRVNLTNARGRPLVSGDATRRQLLILGLGAGASALVVAWMVNWRVGTVVAAGLALNVAYSFRPLRLSDRGLLAVLLLPLGYVVLPFLVGVFTVQSTLGSNGFVILVGLYITFMGRIVLKDFRDEVGDRLFGKRTFLIRRGRADTCLFSAACWIAGSAALIAIVPLRSVVIGVFLAYLGCVLHGLYLLARADGHTAEQVVIGAIAQASRGMGISLLIHLTMSGKGWPMGDQVLIHLSVAAAFVLMYLETAAQRETVDAAVVRPF